MQNAYRVAGASAKINYLKTVQLENVHPRLSATRLLEYFKFRLSPGLSVLLFKNRPSTTRTRADRRNISRICNSILLPVHVHDRTRMQPDDLVSSLQLAFLFFVLYRKFMKQTLFVPIRYTNKFQSLNSEIHSPTSKTAFDH